MSQNHLGKRGRGSLIDSWWRRRLLVAESNDMFNRSILSRKLQNSQGRSCMSMATSRLSREVYRLIHTVFYWRTSDYSFFADLQFLPPHEKRYMIVLHPVQKHSGTNLFEYMENGDPRSKAKQKRRETAVAHRAIANIVVGRHSDCPILPIEWLSEIFRPTQEGK